MPSFNDFATRPVSKNLKQRLTESRDLGLAVCGEALTMIEEQARQIEKLQARLNDSRAEAAQGSLARIISGLDSIYGWICGDEPDIDEARKELDALLAAHKADKDGQQLQRDAAAMRATDRRNCELEAQLIDRSMGNFDQLICLGIRVDQQMRHQMGLGHSEGSLTIHSSGDRATQALFDWIRRTFAKATQPELTQG